MMKIIVVALALIVATVAAETYFKETFEDGAKWKDRWVQSSARKDGQGAGEFKLTAGEFYGDAEEDKGIQTSQDAKFYFLTSKAPKAFSNKGKKLVLQFSVKHEQNIDCGGGYIKLLSADTNQKDFTGDSEYAIMFGPDICGTSTKRVHVIFTYKGKNLLIKKDIKCESDRLTHVYTLIVNPDNTYEVRIDGAKKESGSLLEDWDFLKPKTIPDPSVSKPADWVDEPKMDDPEDVKPADYDDVAKEIPDPDAAKPEDWDEESDGAWEAPKIPNPEYKGEWKPRKIKNPAYKGKWVQPEIANPEYVADDEVYAFDNLGVVGFDLWQVKAGTIFDNIIVTDSVKEAEDLLAATWSENKDAEKKALDAIEAKKREEDEAARKKAEAEAAAKKDDEDDEEDDEDHDEL
jgi:calreticulin